MILPPPIQSGNLVLMGRPNHSISTKVDKELLTRIDAVADERGVSRSAVVRELILEALDADHDPNAAMVAQLQQVQERLERLATQPPTELMAEVQRLHERLDNLEQQSHHQSSQLAAIPLPPPLGQSPTELTVDLSPDELATLLEPDPLAPDFSTPESIASELVTSGAIAPNLSDPESVAPESIAPSSSDPEPTAALAPEADSALLAKTVVETDTPVSALLPELAEDDDPEAAAFDSVVPVVEPDSESDLAAGLAAVSMLPPHSNLEPDEENSELTLEDSTEIEPDSDLPELTLADSNEHELESELPDLTLAASTKETAIEPDTEFEPEFEPELTLAESTDPADIELDPESTDLTDIELEPELTPAESTDPEDIELDSEWDTESAAAFEDSFEPELTLAEVSEETAMAFDPEPELDPIPELTVDELTVDELPESSPLPEPTAETTVAATIAPPVEALKPTEEPDLAESEELFDPFGDDPFGDALVPEDDASLLEDAPDLLEPIPELAEESVTEQSEVAKTPPSEQEAIAELPAGAELNFDELCQYIGVHPQKLTAVAYKRNQSPISALAWRTGWTFNLITQRFTKPGA